MDLGALFLLLTLVLLVGAIISRPFFFREAEETEVSASLPEEHQRSTLLAERDRLLNALRELEFDHNLGKVPEEDFPEQRAALVKATADVLRQLDAIEGAAAPEGKPAAAVEMDGQPEIPDEDLEELVAAHRRARPVDGKATGFCSKCGKPAAKTDKFCSRCGAAL
jgi:hypothetical protein